LTHLFFNAPAPMDLSVLFSDHRDFFSSGSKLLDTCDEHKNTGRKNKELLEQEEKHTRHQIEQRKWEQKQQT
jgi:hypothetical protein